MGSPGVSDITRWLEAYRRAWEERDAAAAAALFTDDAVYRSSPFREPHIGTAGIREYWTDATSRQSNIRVLIGRPIVEGKRVAVEWWANYTDDEAGERTLPGILFLRFANDGRCEELRETWQRADGTYLPHDGWGT